MLHVDNCPGGDCGCYTVRVYEPDCPCPPCTRGERWFMCQRTGERHVATYVGANDRAAPLPADITYLRSLHPVEDLIYADR